MMPVDQCMAQLPHFVFWHTVHPRVVSVSVAISSAWLWPDPGVQREPTRTFPPSTPQEREDYWLALGRS